jgi:hypothetical protein
MSATKTRRFACLAASSLVLALCSFSAVAQNNANLVPFKNLADFESCQRHHFDDEDCLNALEKYARAKPKDAMEASKMVRRRFNAPVSLRFFEIASKQNSKDFCQDKDLQLAVVYGLALPKDYPDAERARRFFSGKCYAEHTDAVIKELNGVGSTSYQRENACPILQKHSQAPASCQPAQATEPVASVDESLPKIDKSQIKLGAVKVYRGPEGERVTMAPIQGGDLYLIRFDGTSSPWEGKSLLHKRADRGNDAADYWTENNGGRWNSVVRRDGMEIYVPGYKPRKGFSVGYSEKLSQEADANTLLNAYQP